MSRITACLALIFFLTSVASFGQRQITAKVVDKESQKPVKEAVVKVDGTDISTTTNVLGFFQLSIDTLKDLIIESPEYEISVVTVPDVNNFRIEMVKAPPVDKDDEKIFMIVDQQAEFTGGLNALGKFISANLRYPQDARRKGIEGQVFVSFVIDKTGAVLTETVEVVKGVSPSIDAEAVRVIKGFPDWIPGKQKGKPVKSRFVIPLRFRLEGLPKKR
jgi:TonB family protein